MSAPCIMKYDINFGRKMEYHNSARRMRSFPKINASMFLNALMDYCGEWTWFIMICACYTSVRSTVVSPLAKYFCGFNGKTINREVIRNCSSYRPTLPLFAQENVLTETEKLSFCTNVHMLVTKAFIMAKMAQNLIFFAINFIILF